jgi:hypothetical protein
MHSSMAAVIWYLPVDAGRLALCRAGLLGRPSRLVRKQDSCLASFGPLPNQDEVLIPGVGPQSGVLAYPEAANTCIQRSPGSPSSFSNWIH